MIYRFVDVLEGRRLLAAPAAPVIIEPLTDGQVISSFDVHMEVDPNKFSDPDGDTHKATNWQIKETSAAGGAVVWQALNVTDPLSKIHIHLGDGSFVGTLVGKSSLAESHSYVLTAQFIDSANEVSSVSTRSFKTTDPTSPVPGAGTWIVHEGYKMDLAATAGAFRMPVNIAFVPNPGPNSTDPYYYVTELYGSIKMVNRAGQVSTYASGLLDYNPQNPIPGTGEQGLTGLAVDPASGDLFVGMLWNNGTSDATRGGSTLHYPKVERLHSTDGGKTMATRSVILNMQPEVQGQSHQISSLSIGPDGKLYVHMGDGFIANTSQDLEQYRGKILRMNLNGTSVASGDPAGANPFYNGGTITARDYVWADGFRNPFGGAWRGSTHWVVENGNQIDRMVDASAGQNLGWNGTDASLSSHAKYVWDPAIGPVNIAFTQQSTFGGSLFPATSMGGGFVSLSGPTYASGPQAGSKDILWFPDMTTTSNGKLSVAPITLVNYNGTGKATVVALTAAPDGLYFSDFYRDDGSGGATASGANIYRIRYTDFHPTNVAATLSAGKASLTWTADPLATSYNVYRSSNGGARTKVGSNLGGTSFTDTTIVTGAAYDYVVLGVNAAGESNDSNIAHVTATIPTSFVGTSQADNWYLKRNGSNLEIWVGGAAGAGGSGSPAYSTVYASASALSFSGQAGADVLTIDNSAGNAIPAAGVSFDGGADSDSFNFIGTSSSDSVTFNSNSLVIGITTGTLTSVESRVFTGGGGGDNVSIHGGRVAINSAQSIANLDASGGTLDVADDAIVFPYSSSSPIGSWTGSTYDGVTGQVKSGRNGGAWNGATGIVSTKANGTRLSVGVAEASAVLKISGTQSGTFAGFSVDATTVLVKYTYGGDANLDGKINVDDYSRIDSSIRTAARGWYNGDFNYDGKINVDDYGIIDFNLGAQGAPIFSGTASMLALAPDAAPAIATPPDPIRPLTIDRTDLTDLLA